MSPSDEEDDTFFAVWVAGIPRALPRGRAFAGRKRPVSIVSPAARRWRAALEHEMAEARARLVAGTGTGELPAWLAGEPLDVDMVFRMPIARTSQWVAGAPHIIKPDADNLGKMVLDAMESSGLLPGGDQRVAGLRCLKVFARVPGVLVRVRECIPGAEGGEPAEASGEALAELAGGDWLRE